jgi:hypothetical protein
VVGEEQPRPMQWQAIMVMVIIFNDKAICVCGNNIHGKQNLLPQIFGKQKAMSLLDRYTVLYTADGVYPRYVAVSCT